MAEVAEADFFLGRQLRLRQMPHGHRAGTDAVLLAAAAPADVDGLALDVGAGVGAAGLALARLRPTLKFGLVEKEAETAALARENLRLNDLADRGAVYETSVFDPRALHAAGLAAGAAALVITNPPFLDPARSRLSPDANKRAAHAMASAGSDPLRDWLHACLMLLEEDGALIVIHRAEALPVILPALVDRVAVTLMPVMPRAGQPAKRILVRARKGGKAPFAIAPPLILHEGERFTPIADAIHGGKALIDW